MSSFLKFKEWLTVEEAASYLTTLEKEVVTADDLWLAIYSDAIQAHFWPLDKGRLGLFGTIAQLPEAPEFKFTPEFRHLLPSHSADFICEFFGPIPIYCYEHFRAGLEMRGKKAGEGLLGLTVAVEHGTASCYRLGDDNKPLSLDNGDFEILIHHSDIKKFHRSWRDHDHTRPDPEVFIFGIDMDGPGDANCLASSAVTKPGVFRHDIEIGAPRNQAVQDESPMTKALAIAVHLIQQLGEDLDSAENVPSRKKNFARSGQPNIRRIAKALEETAKKLNYDEHGFGFRGFEENIRKALKQLG